MEQRPIVRRARSPRPLAQAARRPAPATAAPAPAGPNVAAEIKALVERGARDEARERFAVLVDQHQRRAARLAYHLLRDAADADDAVQDTFLKVFTHITSYDPRWPFEAWFTRILVNTCRDRRKARSRRLQWSLPAPVEPPADFDRPTPEPTAEERLMSRDRWRRLAQAIDQLPGRQRTVFLLCHVVGQTAGEVGTGMGLSEATVRVHLFRAVRKLRHLLEEWRDAR